MNTTRVIEGLVSPSALQTHLNEFAVEIGADCTQVTVRRASRDVGPSTATMTLDGTIDEGALDSALELFEAPA